MGDINVQLIQAEAELTAPLRTKYQLNGLLPDILLTEEINRAYAFLKPHIPTGTLLTIEKTDNCSLTRYLVRLEYTSPKTGRKLTLLAKGEHLPTLANGVINFYIKQIVLTPSEINREFSRLYFRERVARQNAFLFGGGKARGNDVRVVKPSEEADRLVFEQYS